MANVNHNIICLEAEWEYRKEKRNKFSLNTEPLLNWLRDIQKIVNQLYVNMINIL